MLSIDVNADCSSSKRTGCSFKIYIIAAGIACIDNSYSKIEGEGFLVKNVILTGGGALDFPKL